VKRTTTNNWQRARTREQITERAGSILAAAARLFETRKYEEVTLQNIAIEAGFTRSNVYRYFQTRQTIFLELYKYDLSVWVTDFAPTERRTIFRTFLYSSGTRGGWRSDGPVHRDAGASPFSAGSFPVET